jgi:hypothetical protein
MARAKSQRSKAGHVGENLLKTHYPKLCGFARDSRRMDLADSDFVGCTATGDFWLFEKRNLGDIWK